MYSTVLKGKVLDQHYKKYGDNGYTFYIGDIYVGIVFNMGRSGWDVVNSYKSGTEDYKFTPIVRGFKTRYSASEYLILFNELHDGYRKDREEREESFNRVDKMIREHKDEMQ
jgi:hypothetical protein